MFDWRLIEKCLMLTAARQPHGLPYERFSVDILRCC